MGLEAATETEKLEVKLPDWTAMPLWERKLDLWARLIEKGCTSKRGRNFCSWSGHVCFYNGCPRRIFKENAVAGTIPQPVPSPDFVKAFKAMQQTVVNQGKQIKKTTVAIAELEKEKENSD